MQLRGVGLRSVRPSSQKLWPKLIFAFNFPCILHYEPKKIRSPFSRHFSDPTQKTKLSQMVKKTRIQPVPVMGSNLNQNDSRYWVISQLLFGQNTFFVSIAVVSIYSIKHPASSSHVCSFHLLFQGAPTLDPELWTYSKQFYYEAGDTLRRRPRLKVSYPKVHRVAKTSPEARLRGN